MQPRLTVTGADVLFAHWRVDPEAVDAVLPDDLTVDTFDGSAWVSALALENRSVSAGSIRLPAALDRLVPQLNFRTYVTRDGDEGVYFLSLDTGFWAVAGAGTSVFGLPFTRARMRITRQGDRIAFRSRREPSEGPAAVFQARYRPDGERYRAEPGSLAEFCIEQYRYFLPASEASGAAALRVAGPEPSGTIVGRIDRDPWELQPVSATIRENTLFEAAGLPAPAGEPVFHYSPGFEMEVLPEAVRPTGGDGSGPETARSADGPTG